ncbi:MAG: pantetheine-phosphate adenylyltransferase [Bacteroidales bacterium]|nr:pantetheine-phosphate adenylyltransferase [Bacteroidales bacterium]
MAERIAVFPGSFNPFTIGHKAILEKALPLFDKIIIAIGYNSDKQTATSIEERKTAIQKIYNGNNKVVVTSYTTLTVDFCKEQGATFLIRGLRNESDFAYEQPIAQTNLQLAGIETIFFVTPPEYSHISSSIVRELQSYGADVTKFLP